MSDYPTPRRAVRRRPIVTLSAAHAVPHPPHRANADASSAAASPHPDIDDSPRDFGAIRGCALAMVLPALMALWAAVEVALWLTGAR